MCRTPYWERGSADAWTVWLQHRQGGLVQHRVAAVINCTAIPSTSGVGKMWMEIEEQAFVADYNNNPLVQTGLQGTPAILPTPSDPVANKFYNYQS